MKTIQENWYDLLRVVIEDGETHEKDDGDVLQEHLINHCMISNPLKQIGNTHITSEMFIDLIKKGAFDIKDYPIKGPALAEYVESLIDEEIIRGGGFVYTYPERIFNIKLSNRDNEVRRYNQFRIMCNRLKNYDGSNRAVMTLYSAGLDETEQHIPCLQFLQATIRNNKLMLHVFFRSNDLYSAFPSNMLFVSYIGIKLTENLKETYPLLEFEGISYNSSSLHIYQGDIEQAKKIINGD